MHNGFYRCRAEAPDLKRILPASVFRRVASVAYEVAIHSGHAMMQPGWGDGCAFYESLKATTQGSVNDKG